MIELPTATMKLQFRLRTLMIAVTLLAVPLGYVGWQAKIARERRAMRERITKLDHGQFWPVVDSTSRNAVTIPWIRALVSDDAVELIMLPLETNREERRRIRQVFPESKLRWLSPGVGNIDGLVRRFPDDD